MQGIANLCVFPHPLGNNVAADRVAGLFHCQDHGVFVPAERRVKLFELQLKLVAESEAALKRGGIFTAFEHTDDRRLAVQKLLKRMVEDGRDCSEVLIQLAAVRSALNNTAKVILKDHLEHCLTGVSEGNTGQLQDLNDAIDRFLN